MGLALKEASHKADQERSVPKNDKRAKVFEGIHKSDRFSAASAHKAFAGVKARKK